MRISERGIALIKRYEGFSPVPYVCPAGYLTVGYGHVMQAYEAIELREEEATEVLITDACIAEVAVMRLIRTPLTQLQFDALVSFTFNLGAGALQRSTLRRKINLGEHSAVPHELSKWVFAAGKRLPGLVARRKAEATLYGENQ